MERSSPNMFDEDILRPGSDQGGKIHRATGLLSEVLLYFFCNRIFGSDERRSWRRRSLSQHQSRSLQVIRNNNVRLRRTCFDFPLIISSQEGESSLDVSKLETPKDFENVARIFDQFVDGVTTKGIEMGCQISSTESCPFLRSYEWKRREG